MAITLKDVASLAGVSRSAVSRTFTKGASVSPATREKVMQAATALGYSPNALASSLTTGRTKMIGLVSNNFHNPVFLQVFDLFTRGLQARDLRPILVNLTDEVDPTASIKLLRQYSVDGVIVASSTLPDSFAREFRIAGIPAVHSFGRQTAQPVVDVLGIDNIAAGRLAARTLMDRGYTNIAFLGGPANATSTQDRKSGFLAEVALHRGITASSSFASAYSFDAGYQQMQILLQSPLSQAYFCGDDVLSIGALAALQGAGLCVPKDVGLIGLNDMTMAAWANINLTTISNPFAAIIAASIERVMTIIAAPDTPPRAQLFDCEVIERGTLRPV